ncbi:TrkA family potassium uptake protein [Marinobacteraceae bacterium S3BR75-40.1]
MSKFAVIGLGTFGRTVARELIRLGHEVLGADISQQAVDRMSNELTYAVIADATNEQALKELNVENFDSIMVAIGENLEASLLCTLHLKDMGMEDVWVKAITLDHHRILAKLGATRIIHPEYEMGLRAAQALNYPMIRDYLALGDDYFVVEVEAGEGLSDRTVEELLENAESEVHVLAIKRSEKMNLRPDPQYTVQERDKLVLCGPLDQLKSMADTL